jgi:hypothetical protein
VAPGREDTDRVTPRQLPSLADTQVPDDPDQPNRHALAPRRAFIFFNRPG